MKRRLKKVGIILSVVFNCAFLTGYIILKVAPRQTIEKIIYRRVKKSFERVGLSDEQKQTLLLKIEESYRKLDPLTKEIAHERIEMVELLAENPINQEKIEFQRQKIARLQQEIQKYILTQIVEFKPLLTEQQQEKFFQYLKDRLQKNSEESEKRKLSI